MVKGLGRSSSNKIIKTSKQAPGKQSVRAACPQDMLEFNFFSRPVHGYYVFFRDLLNFVLSLSVTYHARVYCSTRAEFETEQNIATFLQFCTNLSL